MIRRLLMILAPTILALNGAAQAADMSQPKRDQCFRSERYEGFRAINDHAFNIRVGGNEFYRIELSGSCPMLTAPDAMLITHVRGSDLMCGPLDWDLSVRESGPGAISIGCIVKSQERLTPEEAAAIPPREKP